MPPLARSAALPGFDDLLAEFVQDVCEREAQMRHLHQARDWEGLKHLAHQLSGTAGAYGFPELSQAAGQLEQCCETRCSERIERALRSVCEVCAALPTST